MKQTLSENRIKDADWPTKTDNDQLTDQSVEQLINHT